MGKVIVADSKNIYTGALMHNNGYLRTIMYHINNNGLGEDLVYEPAEYLVAGVKSKKLVRPEFIITNIIKMTPILEFAGYKGALTQKDINKAFDLLFENDKWLSKNMVAFGFVKNGSEWEPGGIARIPETLYTPYRVLLGRGNIEPSPEEPTYKYIKRKK